MWSQWCLYKYSREVPLYMYMHSGTWLKWSPMRQKSVSVIEVAALTKYGVLPFELELHVHVSGCTKEVAALHSDHYPYTDSTA